MRTQLIDVLPLNCCFVETDLGCDVFGHLVQFLVLKNSEGSGLNFVERCIFLCSKELEHLGCLAQVLIDIDTLFAASANFLTPLCYPHNMIPVSPFLSGLNIVCC